MKLAYTDNTGKAREIGIDITYSFTAPDAHGARHPKDTYVYLYDLETKDILARGWALLHDTDNFNKAMGRRIAFQRAVDEFTGKVVDAYGRTIAQGDKAVRVQLWESYIKNKVRLP